MTERVFSFGLFLNLQDRAVQLDPSLSFRCQDDDDQLVPIRFDGALRKDWRDAGEASPAGI
jgi:hypothetical protein